MFNKIVIAQLDLFSLKNCIKMAFTAFFHQFSPSLFSKIVNFLFVGKIASFLLLLFVSIFYASLESFGTRCFFTFFVKFLSFFTLWKAIFNISEPFFILMVFLWNFRRFCFYFLSSFLFILTFTLLFAFQAVSRVFRCFARFQLFCAFSTVLCVFRYFARFQLFSKFSAVLCVFSRFSMFFTFSATFFGILVFLLVLLNSWLFPRFKCCHTSILFRSYSVNYFDFFCRIYSCRILSWRIYDFSYESTLFYEFLFLLFSCVFLFLFALWVYNVFCCVYCVFWRIYDYSVLKIAFICRQQMLKSSDDNSLYSTFSLKKILLM